MAAFGSSYAGSVRPQRHVPLHFADYRLGPYLMSGGWGTVYSATDRSGKKVAMKFFGYTVRAPILEEINKEIDLMASLSGIPGVVQLEGVFQDTAQGLVPNKAVHFQQPYPVIVMEMVEGGDLFDRIANRRVVSESYLAVAFRSAMIALEGIHSRRFIHRDLKLDNLLMMSNEENSSIKIIDFGLMVRLADGQSIFQDRDVVGTEGFFAPESIQSHQYSYKSDVWQAGCILYCMLCGHPAFHSEARYRSAQVRGQYYPMVGPEWTSISEQAKDLVRKMLAVRLEDRLSVNEVLHHPWLRGSAPDTDLGSGYKRRVKALALRKTMKRIFMDRDIEDEHRERRIKLDDQFGGGTSTNPASPVVGIFRGVEFGAKLKDLKNVLLKNLGVTVVQPLDVAPSMSGLPTVSGDSDSSDEDLRILRGEIDVETYCSIMCSVGLDTLATKEIFRIFDINGDGQIELKEFLLTLMSFRAPDEHDAAVLYFHLFDLNEDGFIDVDELRAVVACLVHDSSGPLLPDGVVAHLPNVEELFDVIDTNPRDGRIDLDEFTQFYHTVLLPTVSRRISTRGVVHL